MSHIFAQVMSHLGVRMQDYQVVALLAQDILGRQHDAKMQRAFDDGAALLANLTVEQAVAKAIKVLKEAKNQMDDADHPLLG